MSIDAERQHGAIGSVQLVEIDIVGAQPLEAVVELGVDVASIEPVAAATELARIARPARPGDLGGEYDPLAPTAAATQVPIHSSVRFCVSGLVRVTG